MPRKPASSSSSERASAPRRAAAPTPQPKDTTMNILETGKAPVVCKTIHDTADAIHRLVGTQATMRAVLDDEGKVALQVRHG